jgi:hypothetical protein
MNKLLKIAMPIVVTLGLVVAIGCAAAPQSSEPMPAPAPMPAPPRATDSAGEAEFRPGGGDYDESGADRKIIRTGHLTLEVEDILNAMDGITRLAGELDGYVVSSRKYEQKDELFGWISIRVPAERFHEAFDRLRQLATDVPEESTESRDVTEEYTDLEAQLRNLEATEAQYLAILEKAVTVEDILAVQRELSNVRREIERIKGHMQYLERTSDMALIEVNLKETKAIGQTGWDILKTFKAAVHGLTTFGRVLADIAIWLVIFCWIWIPVLVFLLRRRRKAKAKING